MLSPTHVQILVQRARGLKFKGKNGTNDAFVSVEFGKEKFLTGVQEKCENPNWNEECLLPIPATQSSSSQNIIVKVHHRNFMGGDEFLGQVCLDIDDFDVYQKPKSCWHPLTCKPGQNKTGYRGDLELRLGFSVNNFVQPSHYDQSHSERRKSVTQQLLKTEKISHWSDDAININDDPGVVSEIEDDELLDDLVTPVDTPSHSSEDILEMFDNTGSLSSTPRQSDDTDATNVVDNDNDTDLDLDHATSQQSQHLTQSNNDDDTVTNTNTPSSYNHEVSNNEIKNVKHVKSHEIDEGYFSRKVSVESTASTSSASSSDSSRSSSSSVSGPPDGLSRVVLGRDSSPDPDSPDDDDESQYSESGSSHVPEDVLERFSGQSREDLIEMVCFLQRTLETQGKKLADLEDYIDWMVLRVMESAPVILEQNIKQYYCNLYNKDR